jgi:hypothetical protein
MKMAFSIVAFLAIAAISSPEGKGSMLLRFPPIIGQYHVYHLSYKLFDVAEAIWSQAPKYLLVDCTASTTPSKLFPIGYLLGVVS